METIFGLATFSVVPFWLLMVALPHWRLTRRLMELPIAETLLGLVYIVLALTVLPTFIATFTDPTVAGIAAFMAAPVGVTIGWVHFLAFDLFVGRWIYRDSRERGISAWLVAPPLLVFLAGPTGLVLYLPIRAALARRTPRAGNTIAQGGRA